MSHITHETLNPELINEEYRLNGLVRDSYPLAKPDRTEDIRRDLPMYRHEVDRNRNDALFRVPYLLTQSIIEAAHDDNILQLVSSALGTDELVMWGPNMQRGTPNEAGTWHTDIESWFWASITVVVGLNGCEKGNSTKCIPGSQTYGVQPWAVADNADDDDILEKAKRINPNCKGIQTFDGFENGMFYAFNARAWHSGVTHVSKNRDLLFLHYNRAADLRIPYMKNYWNCEWFDFPATYITIDNGKPYDVERETYPTEGRDYIGWAEGLMQKRFL